MLTSIDTISHATTPSLQKHKNSARPSTSRTTRTKSPKRIFFPSGTPAQFVRST